MKNELPEDEMIRRKFAISLLSVAGLASAPTQWTAPVVNAVILPAHAQTSCTAPITDIDVLGKWRFTDPNGLTFDLEFIDSVSLIYTDASVSGALPWQKLPNGELSLDLNSPKSPWLAQISDESSCVASKITIYDFQSDSSSGAFVAPVEGVRI